MEGATTLPLLQARGKEEEEEALFYPRSLESLTSVLRQFSVKGGREKCHSFDRPKGPRPRTLLQHRRCSCVGG